MVFLKVCVVSEENFLQQLIEERTGGSVEVEHSTARTPQAVMEILNQYDLVVLNHMTSQNRRIIEALTDRSKIVEMSIVKTPMLRYSGQVVSLSLMNELEGDVQKLTLSSISDVTAPDSQEVISALFPGVQVVEKTAEEHDRLMSELLVKPYIFSLLSRKITDLDQTPKTGEYEMVLEISRYVTNYNIDHIRDMLRNNPNTPEIFSKFEENVKRVWNELSLL